MSFKTVCPSCDAELTAPDTVLGKRVKCKKCGDPFTAKRADELDDDEDDRPAKPTVTARPKPAVAKDDDASSRKSTKASRPTDDDDEEEDDEPKPKTKKKGKKKKKKEGLPMALVIGVIAGVLLIGGGIVAYFGFIKEDKPTDPVVAKGDGPPGDRGKSRGGPGRGPDGPAISAWPEHHDTLGRFRVKFPGAPSKVETDLPPEARGKVSIWQTQLGSANGLEIFASVHIAAPAAERMGATEEQIIDQILQLLKAQLPGGGEITGGKEVTHQGYKGRDSQLTENAKQIGTIRVIVAPDRVICLVHRGSTIAERTQAFFESLKIE